MVEKGVPSGWGGGVVVDSSGGENHPSAVATEAAEHPQKPNEAWVEYEAFLRKRLNGIIPPRIQREILEYRKQDRQSIIYESLKEILVLNKLLEELKQK